MDSDAVVLLAAGIPAFGAAVTFAITQVIAIRSASRQQAVDGLLKVLDALEAIPLNLTRPRLLALFVKPDLPLAFACTRLIHVLPKHDRIMWQWLTLKAEEVAKAKGLARVATAAEMQGTIVAYLSDRRKTCRGLQAIAAGLDRPDRFY